MKKYTLLVLFVLAAQLLSAQHIHGYFHVGGTAAQIEGDELKGFDKFGCEAGVGAMIDLSSRKRWLLGVESNFAQRGAYNNSGDPYNIKLQMNYVDIPVTLFYHDPYGGIYAGLGVVYGRLVQQPHDEMRYNPNYFIPDTSDMSFLKSDLQLAAEFKFAIWKGLQLGFRWQRSVLPVKKDWGFTEYYSNNTMGQWTRDCRNSMVSVRLLWQFGTDESIPSYDNSDRSRGKHHRRRR